MIIQGRTDALLDQLVDNIPHLQEAMSPQWVSSLHLLMPELHLTGRLLSPLLRFFAHLVLVLRALGQSVPDDAANLILQAYVSVLQQEGNDQLVAMYAACLREGSGEQSYARFLRCKSNTISVKLC
jgi:nuclear pore complex protein Nup107